MKMERVISFLLALVMMLSCVPLTAMAAEAEPVTAAAEQTAPAPEQSFKKVLHLDCGRKYFTKDWIIAMINEMAADGYTHLQLAFGNDGLRFLLNDMSAGGCTGQNAGSGLFAIDNVKTTSDTAVRQISKDDHPAIFAMLASPVKPNAPVGKPAYLDFDPATGAVTCLDKSVTSVVIPETIGGVKVTAIGARAFESCGNLTSVVIPQSVTSIGEYAFAGCARLTEVKIPAGVRSIGQWAFYSSGLTEVKLPDGITSIEIGTFASCAALTDIEIPGGVARIGNFAFIACTGLRDVRFAGTQSQWSGMDVGNENSCLLNADIHYNYKPAHTHSFTSTEVAATCTQKGYTLHTCACGYEYRDKFTPALGHEYVDGVCIRCFKAPGENQPNATDVFLDVSNNWTYEGIQYCYDHGLMSGTSYGTFSPNGTMTRGMFAMVLWNQAEKPEPTAETPFTDFTKNYYRKAIAWAYENEIVGGTTPTTFAPDAPITREQVAAILYRYAKNYLKLDVSASNDITGYPDYSNVSNYAKVPLSWANAEGIITGSKDGGQVRLLPGRSATRAQGAKILMVFSRDVMN